MAITNYTELKDAVADWLNRADLTSQVPTFIQLAEARFNRIIRTRDMITRANATTNNEFVPMPIDWLETYKLELPPNATNTPEPLMYVGPEEASRFKANAINGKPRYYSILDGAFELIPAPSVGTTVTLELTYYARITSLSTGNPSNWLILKAPDLYLYASLMNAEPFLNNDERIPTWAQLSQSALDELDMDSERASRSRTSLNARRRSF
jgi:hypothetical protein